MYYINKGFRPDHDIIFTPMSQPFQEPELRVLSTDDILMATIKSKIVLCRITAYTDTGSGPILIDPAVGTKHIKDRLSAILHPAPAAIVRRPHFSGAMFLAARLTRGHIIENPCIDPHPLSLFIKEHLGIDHSAGDRRIFPRAAGSGVTVYSPPGTSLVNISAYGACIRTSRKFMNAQLVRLRIQLKRLDKEVDVDCKVAFSQKSRHQAELRLFFYKMPVEAQQELMRISNAELLCTTIADTLTRFESEELTGFRQITKPSEILEILDIAVFEKATFTFATMFEGRPVRAIPMRIDPENRNYLVAMQYEKALGKLGAYLQFSTSMRHESYLLDGYVLKNRGQHTMLSFPKICLSTDHRAQEREGISGISPFFVIVSGRKYPVKEFSSRGFSFYSPEHHQSIPESGQVTVTFDLGEEIFKTETILIKNRKVEGDMVHTGALFIDTPEQLNALPPHPLIEHTLIEETAPINRSPTAYTAERVTFTSTDKKIVGLWHEAGHANPATVVIIPPAWAKTKESTALLSQYILSTFEANQKSVAVLRFDYSNAIGESDKSPSCKKPGHDTLGLTFTACVEDIKAAICYATRRASPRRIALVGMSFSGPLCLRAAVTHGQVTHLIQFMGASDIQDLVRTATGGIDYVSRFRAGIRSSVQNVLGMLSDTDKWCRDGMKANLVLLQDAQSDASKLTIPLLWIHGTQDAFVNESRIRSILDVVHGEKYLFRVPYGHIPTKSHDALQAFLPAIRFLMTQTGIPDPVISAPYDQVIMEVATTEWSHAPRVRLPSLKEFWHDYMIGTTAGSLGFDILSMTRGYRELMTCQTELMDIKGHETIHDIGGGMGHAISYLAGRSGAIPAAVHLYDFVPQLFDIARKKAQAAHMPFQASVWNGEAPDNTACFESAEILLMSLFLSCLSHPEDFLARLCKTVPKGSQVIASTIRPDADISMEYMALLADIKKGDIAPPEGYSRHHFLQAVRDYMNSAAWLLRLTDEGTFHLFEKNEFIDIFIHAGFKVLAVKQTFGTPHRAVVIKAVKA